MFRVKEIHREATEPFGYKLLIESFDDEPGPERLFWLKYDPRDPERIDIGGVAGVTPSSKLETVVRDAVAKYKVPPGSKVEIAEPPPPLGARKTVVVTPEPAAAHAKANDPSTSVSGTPELSPSERAQGDMPVRFTDKMFRDRLKSLPRWARVAFAARCARRVMPVLERLPSGPPVEVAQAIVLAEEYAARAGVGKSDLEEAARVRDASYRLAEVFPEERIRMAVMAAVMAAEAAYGAATSDENISHADEAAGAAVGAYPPEHERHHAAQWHDLDLLLERAEADGWTDETPVPKEFFGPIWPDGPPPGWPEPLIEVASTPEGGTTSIESGAALKSLQPAPITVYLDPGDAPQELITEFYLALSALYRAHGGDGLRIVSDELGSVVSEEAEA